MCSELILAFIYFLTICVINFFLSRLIIFYVKKIFYFVKFKNIFRFYSVSDLTLLSFLYFYSKEEFSNIGLLKNINKIKSNDDPVTIGNIYKFLSMTKSSKKNKSANFYFKLLENQYISSSIKINE
jgi:hypothetical protein